MAHPTASDPLDVKRDQASRFLVGTVRCRKRNGFAYRSSSAIRPCTSEGSTQGAARDRHRLTTFATGLRHSEFTMTETGTTKGVTTPRALSLAMGVVALISWASFAYAVDALRDSPVLHDRPAGSEQGSGRVAGPPSAGHHRAG